MSTLHDLPPATVPRLALAADPPTGAVVPPLSVPDGFDQLLRAVRPRLLRSVARRLGSRSEAEEVVQEALLRAARHAHQLATEDDVAAWCTVVAGRLAIDRLRVRARSTSVAEVPEAGRTARDTADVVVAREEARTALDALDALPTRQAAVLWAREVEGLGYVAIGERYAMTEPTVRSLLSRARAGLRREFSARGGTLPAVGPLLLVPLVGGAPWSARLRRLVGAALAPAAVAALAAGVLGGVLLQPGPPGDGPAAVPAVGLVRAAPATLPARVAAAPARSAPATVAPRATAGRRAHSASPAPGLHLLDRACTPTSLPAGAGASACAPAATRGGDALVVDAVRLPDNPTGASYAGVTSDLVACASVPDTPVTRCAPAPAAGARPAPEGAGR